jgi:tRNA nucleotidyltransferase (CCA-adding enzyme)
VVGGCVRDHLLGRAVSDWDVCTSARPEEVVRLFPRSIPTGMAHGTVTVVRGGAHYEVTTLRGEGTYSDGRRPDAVHFLDDVRDDLARRDFTVNAIAYDPLGHTLVDPFGGRDDLRAGLLRAVGDPLQRFREDGLRVLRGARFVASLGFTLEPDTEAAITGALDVFQRVSAERVRDEWVKSMRGEGPERGLRGDAADRDPRHHLPRADGVGGLRTEPIPLVRRVGSRDGLPRRPAPGDPVLRIAALLHDVAKTRTRALSEKTQDYSFYEHERVGAEMVEPILMRLRFSNDERRIVGSLVRHHLVCYSRTGPTRRCGAGSAA